MSDFLRVFQVFEKLFEARYRRRYDTRLQLMAYQIRMLHKGEIQREQRLGGVTSWYYRDAA